MNRIRSHALWIATVALLGCTQAPAQSRRLPEAATLRLGQDTPPSLFGGCNDGCFGVAWSADGQTIATGHSQEARLWERSSGKLLRSFANRGTVYGLAFRPDGGGRTAEQLAWGGFGNSYALVDPQSGATLVSPAVGISIGFFLDFSADGSRLLAAGPVGKGNRWSSILLWNPDTAKIERELRVSGTCWKARITRDGKTAVSGDSTGGVIIWDLTTGESRGRFTVAGGSVLDLALTDDDQRIVAVSSFPRPAVIVADITTGRQLVNIPHREVVRAVAISPDGSLIATAGNQRGILLIDAHTGQQRGKLAGHRGGVSSLAFSPDGRHLLSGGFLGSALVWEVSQGLAPQ